MPVVADNDDDDDDESDGDGYANGCTWPAYTASIWSDMGADRSAESAGIIMSAAVAEEEDDEEAVKACDCDVDGAIDTW